MTILFSNCRRKIVNIFVNETKNSLIIPWLIKRKISRAKTYYETKTFKIFHARCRRKYSFNAFPARSQIFYLIKTFEADGAEKIVG